MMYHKFTPFYDSIFVPSLMFLLNTAEKFIQWNADIKQQLSILIKKKWDSHSAMKIQG